MEEDDDDDDDDDDHDHHHHHHHHSGKWGTTTWSVLRLRMEERPPIWREAANILYKQSRTVDKGWSYSLGVGRGAKNASP